MPVFFVISGAAVYYALRSRKAGGFIKERTLRVLIPLISLGYFIIGPAQFYLERLTHGDFSGSFLQFYPHYFEGFDQFGGNFAWHGMHLWYLLLLFIFSMIALPLLLPSKATGNSMISRLATLFVNPWTILIRVLLITAVEVLADAVGLSWSRVMGGWSLLSYLLFFICGYLIFSNT